MDINEILSITDIYLASSIREGLPVNIMEAMYKGLPIVATDNRGHRELVKKSENGFIVSNNSEMLEKIKNILTDDNMKIKFSNNAKQLAKKYCLSNIINKINEIYKI